MALTRAGTTTAQLTLASTLDRVAVDVRAQRFVGPAVVVIGEVVAMREKLSWFETKPLFGWRVLVPRTKEQAGALSERLRTHGAVAEEVPTISVEPPRTPQQMDRAVQGLVSGRYLWVAFTSVNAVRAVREKFEEYGLDARAFAGVKVAAVGDQTAAALRAFGVQPDLVPTGEQSSAGLLEDWPPYDELLDPINRVFLPRADIATETLVAGLVELGWEVDDVTAYRTVRAAPRRRRDPRGHQGRRLRRGGLHLVVDGPQPGRHRRQAAPHDGDRLHRPADRQDRRGARPPGRRAGRDPLGHRARRRPGRVRRRHAGRRGRGRRGQLAAVAAPCGCPPPGEVGLMAFPVDRPRRLRRTPALRRLVAQTRLDPADLVLPLFVKEGLSEPVAVGAMPGVWQHTRDSLRKAADEAVEAGVGGLILFGIPADKDARAARPTPTTASCRSRCATSRPTWATRRC